LRKPANHTDANAAIAARLRFILRRKDAPDWCDARNQLISGQLISVTGVMLQG
jgi:hypothetical protein